jgi:hypothetical protein
LAADQTPRGSAVLSLELPRRRQLPSYYRLSMPAEEAERVVEETTTAHGSTDGKGDEKNKLDPVQGMQMEIQRDHLLP